MFNWIVIGVGDITRRRVIPAIQAECRSRLYGIVTRDPAKALPYNTRVWTSLAEALCDRAVQAVYVASPVFLHAPQTIQSLRAGKHVLCEKPMAMNAVEAHSMLRGRRKRKDSRHPLLPQGVPQGTAGETITGSWCNRKTSARGTRFS